MSLTKSQLKLLDSLSDELEKELMLQRIGPEIEPQSDNDQPVSDFNVNKDPPAANPALLDLYTNRFNDNCDYFEQFESKLETSIALFDEFLGTYNRLFAELHEFIAKTKPILYEQKRLELSRNRLNEHLQCFRRIEKFDTTIVNSVQNVLRIFDECERNANYLFAHRDFCDFVTYENRIEFALRNVFVILLDWFRDAFDSMDANVCELCTFDSEAVQPGDLLKSYIGHMVKYGTISARFTPIFTEMRSMTTKAQHYNHIYRDWLTRFADFFVMKRTALFEGTLRDKIETLVDFYNQDKCYLFQQLFCHLNKLIAQEIELYEIMFAVSAATVTDTNRTCINSIIETIKGIFLDYFRAVIGRVYHYQVLIELNDITRSQQQQSVNNNFMKEFVDRIAQDIRERFLHRIYIYFETEIMNYNATASDLNYPQKLYAIYRASDCSTKEDRYQLYEGFCYPTLKKTIQVIYAINNVLGDGSGSLAKNSQSIVLEILEDFFRSLRACANELHVESVSPIDANLFELMHLLILREQFKYFDFGSFENRSAAGDRFVTLFDFDEKKTAASAPNNDIVDCQAQSVSLNLIDICLEYITRSHPFLDVIPATPAALLPSKFRIDKIISRLKLYLFDDDRIVERLWTAIRNRLPYEDCTVYGSNYPKTVTIDSDFSWNDDSTTD